MTTVKTRFAPSPTGALHLGNVRTALFSWAYAKRHQGQCLLRLEDTDRERSTDESEAGILQGLSWLGLDFDGPVIRQSDRLDHYQAILESLYQSGSLYACDCSEHRLDALRAEQKAQGLKPKYDGHCRHRNLPYVPGQTVLRFKSPEAGDVAWVDAVVGAVRFDWSELDDWVACRSDGMPTYNFTVVVDDSESGVTHVVRGEDHLSNTPKQMALYQALGRSLPTFAHLPMILGPDGKRLSKRHGAVDTLWYANQGYLPEAMLSYLVRLGWSHGDQEIFSTDEITSLFDFDRVGASASTFDLKKLQWVNRHFVQQLTPEDRLLRLTALAEGRGFSLAQLHLIAEQLVPKHATLVEALDACAFVAGVEQDPDAQALLTPDAQAVLSAFALKLKALDRWQSTELQGCVNEFLAEQGLSMPMLGKPLRVALTGKLQAPSVVLCLALLGADETLKRLDQCGEQQ